MIDYDSYTQMCHQSPHVVSDLGRIVLTSNLNKHNEHTPPTASSPAQRGSCWRAWPVYFFWASVLLESRARLVRVTVLNCPLLSVAVLLFCNLENTASENQTRSC
jgi:hypothetical protein